MIYARVSSDDDGTGRSVAEQLTECRAFANRQGWPIVAEFVDNDRSASAYATKVRPGYRDLCAAITTGTAGALVMWEGSRATRDLTDFAALRDACAVKGMLYAYSGKIHDLSTTDGRFSTSLDAIMAERESSMTRDRVMRAQNANRDNGTPHGSLNYGYAREYETVRVKGRTRARYVRQVEHPQHADIVRWICGSIVDGRSARSIAMTLNAYGVDGPRSARVADGEQPRKALWNPTAIRRIAVNPAYVALRTHGNVIPGNKNSPQIVIGPADWPALISEEMHAACVARLGDRARRSTALDREVKYLCSGIVRCGPCGHPMNTLKGRKRADGTYGVRQYWCAQAGCHKVGIGQPVLDDFVTRVLVTAMADADFVAVFATADAARAGHAATARDQVKVLTKRLDDLYDAGADGSITATGVARMEGKLLAEIEAAERAAQVAEIPAEVREIAGPDAATRWKAMTLPKRRRIVRALMTIHVDPVGRGHRVFNPDRLRIDWRT